MTDVALKEHLERRIEDVKAHLDWRLTDLDRQFSERFRLNDAGVSQARQVMNDRLAAMNEFRDALKDQANRMATRIELDTLDQRVQELQRAKANLDGRLVVISGGISAVIAIVLSMIGRAIP